jgi:ATP-binding cassette subfamily B protein
MCGWDFFRLLNTSFARLFPASTQGRSFFQLLRLLSYLPRHRIKALVALLGLSFLLGLFDLLFVAILARLVGALTGSKLNDHLPRVLVFGGDLADQSIWMVLLLLGLVWLSMALKFGTTLFQSLIGAEIWADYGNIIFSNVLLQDYEFFQSQRSSSLLARLNRILTRIADDILVPLLTIAVNTLNAGVLAIGVVLTIGPVALAIFASLMAAYAAISAFIIPRLRLASKQKIRFLAKINLIVVESLRSIRDVRLYSAERYFLDNFLAIGTKGKRYDRIAKFLPEIPRYLIEPASVTILFAVGLLPVLLEGDLDHIRRIFPGLAAVMFAALKLSSPIQQIFRSINKLRGGLPEITDALDLVELKPERSFQVIQSAPTPDGVMPRHTIQLSSVSYRYPNTDRDVAKSLDLKLQVGSRVAFVGRTGGGKTTAAHLLLGLLRPQQGCLLLDGIPLTEEELVAWHSCCAIVPQNIALLDSNIRSNVAFAVDESLIRDEQVWDALEAAQLADFVAELPYGLYTHVGEDGLRLSGGQRQRLSLARAFYKNAKFLVLDEATSALDTKTESDVMEAIELVGRRCTIVVIAHRLSTIRSCDRIYEFEHGRIKAAGNFEQLLGMSESFSEMVRLGRG